MKINVTYRINVVDLGEDEEFGYIADEDNYFIITGLPTKHFTAFWKKVENQYGCSRRSPANCKDHRLRVDWNNICDYECDYEDFLNAKDAILWTIRDLVPDAKVRYRQLGSGLSEIGDYSDDMMTLEGGFTDEE